MDVLGSLSQSPKTQDSITLNNKCSRKGCSQPGCWQIIWNNPKVHTPDRRKIWLACQEHKSYLEDFLASRKFWIETLALDASASNSSQIDKGLAS